MQNDNLSSEGTVRFTDIIAESEIMNVPKEVRSFLIQHEEPRPDQETWGYFAYGFAAAFRELLDSAGQRAPSRDYLHAPLVFLGRHSIELALKEAIASISRHTGDEPQTHGHNLEQLWAHLIDQIEAFGFQLTDEWTRYCGSLARLITEIDAGGDRFRYPVGRDGHPFVAGQTDLEQLGRIHFHLTMFCDAATSMIEDSAPY